MVILLPREGQYREIEKKVTSEWVQDAVRGFESQEVDPDHAKVPL